ncbi:hypothetical protein AB4144_40435, partial [Rhizobiaceae sp. 2RAB30]
VGPSCCSDQEPPPVASNRRDQADGETIPFGLPLDETFDIGSKTGTPVDDRDYQTPLTFTGKFNKQTISVEPPKLTPEDENKLQAASRAAQDAKWPLGLPA